MATLMINCPNCQHQFEPGGAFMKDFEHQARQKMAAEWHKMKAKVDEDKLFIQQQKELLSKQLEQQEQELQRKLALEKQKLQQDLQVSIRKSIASDYENKLKMLEHSCEESSEKLTEFRKKELEFLQKEQQLKDKEAELEIELQRRLLKQREQLAEQIRLEEAQKNSFKETEFQMKVKELEKQLEVQKKLADEMKRKADQGSMQLQGEVQELLLESILRETFPFDLIEEVGKGVEGADCMQVVRSSSGKECGKIIYESKRTKNWNSQWITKLKADMRIKGADMAIIVTQVFPKDMERFGSKEGIWICSYSEVASVASVLRNAVLCVADAKKSEENKGDKMQMLYSYISSNEFRQQIEAIAESFQSLQFSINKERIQMEKIWKEREKQLQKAFINTVHIYGSMKGILGASVSDIPMLEGMNEIEDYIAN